ncbi:MAG TPA: DUF1127 domain-containing protein [Stellaceae bacterium]|nr:DUF1127 domain-containing protein [Stellaceae bacterium]
MLHRLLERLADYRRRQRAYAELYALDDRSLADIGITRAEIPFLMSRSAEEMAGPAQQRNPFSSFRHA